MRPDVDQSFLQKSVRDVPQCGSVFAARLARLGIVTVRDLLHHFPVRYEDQRNISDVSALVDGEFATVRVRIAQLRSRRAFHRRSLTVVEGLLRDETGQLRVTWFNQPFITKTLALGDEIFLSGKAVIDGFGLKMVSPVYEKIERGRETVHTARVVPMYGLTEGISNKQFRTFVKTALESLGTITDWLPSEICENYQMPAYAEALQRAHFPSDIHEAHEAIGRFQFDEAFLQQLQQRAVIQYNKTVASCPMPLDAEVIKSFIATLPFALTDDQRRAAYAIVKDMEQQHPMNRLLQGDVGSGKTVVAAIAMRHVAAHGGTSLILAPTQILAAQHAVTLRRLLEPVGIAVALLVGGAGTARKKSPLPQMPYVIVGTHALLHDKTHYPQLALVVVDEQHRFGVEQRKAIKGKNKAGYTPHFLSMSATPIPRSLTLMLFGSLAVSQIKQMPVGRKKIITRVLGASDRSRGEAFVLRAVARGEQVFVVAPLIDPSDSLGIESATEVYERLRVGAFAGVRVALVHGRMKPRERASVMDAMRAGELDVLVATAVIEVGVDIPAATIMWIEGAERFGLAQLHQFRGRVGRGDKQSYCFLFSESSGDAARQRLGFMEKYADGFTLAEKDLELRGGGDVWGTMQSGFSELETLRSISLNTWEHARVSAEQVAGDADLLARHPLFVRQIEQFERELHRE